MNSRRHRAWYVQPVQNGADMNTVYNRNTGKILCGYLFNAAAERELLGGGVGEGEECCIAMEPIADARLPFSSGLCVQHLCPTLTGVQLLCGHRFSAVYLLWHWCMSPMICPMCRAEYVLMRNGVRDGGVRNCKIENFPLRSWRMLRRLVQTHVEEREQEEQTRLQAMNRESIVEDVMGLVMGNEQLFMLMISLEGVDASVNVVEYLPLHRTNSNYGAMDTNNFNFNVQRSSLRRFTTVMSNAANEAAATGRLHHRVLRSTVVMRLPHMLDTGDQFVLKIAEVAEIQLPVFRIQQRRVLALELARPSDVDAALGITISIHAPIVTITDSDAVEDVVVAAPMSSEGALDYPIPTTPPYDDTVSISPEAVTTVSSISNVPICDLDTSRMSRIALTRLCRFTNVSAPCVDFAGVVHMEFCEEDISGGLDSLLSVNVSLQAHDLFREVANCVTIEE